MKRTELPQLPSVLDFFTIGVGPSSSHTVGPMRAARTYAERLRDSGLLDDVDGIVVRLHGSLGATGRGHGTDRAVVAGLTGHSPESVEPSQLVEGMVELSEGAALHLLGQFPIRFDVRRDLVFDAAPLGSRPNGMHFEARDVSGRAVHGWSCWSVGGGFVHDPDDLNAEAPSVPLPFWSGRDLLELCEMRGESVAEIVRANEEVHRPWPETRRRLEEVFAAMRASIRRGQSQRGTLPGPLRLPRRASHLVVTDDGPTDDLLELERLAGTAIAVSEENAAGQRVVTAPTNGAAGIIPSVLDHVMRRPEASGKTAITFLLTAGAIAWLCKHNASISGAEVGCQGEVGSACAMAAAGLAAVTGATPAQIENAAEIALEHNLGLSCDPVAGLVQVPCIERNGVGAVKAVVAARLALRGDGQHRVSLDEVLATVRSTGADMSQAYKETSTGGLALNVTVC